MDFYAYQATARNRTRYLVLGFMLAVALVTLSLDVVAFTFLGARATGQPQGPLGYATQHPGPAIFLSLLIVAVIGLASLYKSLELRGGGAVVARSLGGVRIDANTNDLKIKRLHNIVEEMALASGVPVPEIFVLEHEAAINAFAAGHMPANAAITVTQGALDHLDRDELQGVIGHEFSHVLNGDMRLNVQLMGWVFGLLVLTLIGRTVLQFIPRGRDRGSGGAFMVFAMAMIVLGYLGLLAGRILQAAVSRQRERLADASSVQFTRNPQGLKGALIKIAALSEGSYLTASHTESVAHMLFAPGLERVFATHPPLLERILELDPHFDPQEIERVAARSPDALSAIGSGASATELVTTAPAAARSGASQTGNIPIATAQGPRMRLPDALREYADVPGNARALVIALLLARDDAVRANQERLLSGSLSSAQLEAVRQAATVTRTLDPILRLPAVLQIFPALRRLALADRQALMKVVAELLRAEHQVDIFEYCLAKLLTSLLTDQMESPAAHGSVTLEDAVQSIHVLLATMARAGTADDREARTAYDKGMQTVLSMHYPPYVLYADWPSRLDAALPELDALRPFAKQAVVAGLVCMIASDGQVTVEEAELLRTTCALLHCPMPALLAASSTV